MTYDHMTHIHITISYCGLGFLVPIDYCASLDHVNKELERYVDSPMMRSTLEAHTLYLFNI